MTRKGLLTGVVAGFLVATTLMFIDAYQCAKYNAAAEDRLQNVHRELQPFSEERDLVSRFELLSVQCSRANDIIESLTAHRIDPALVDEIAMEAANRAGVSLQQVEWSPDGVFFTIRALLIEPMVLFAEEIEGHPNIRFVEIRRWTDDDPPDRFVVWGRWVPPRRSP